MSNKFSRRSFVQRTAASSLGLLAASSVLSANASAPVTPKIGLPEEWRNKQDHMLYRRLGRTWMMLSEIVMGTFPFNDPQYLPVVEAGVERGINYIDTASSYSNGKVESTLGGFLKIQSKREKVFLATKLSTYYGLLDRFIDEVIKDLPQGKKDALQKQALKLIEERAATKPGYHINYFGGQERQFEREYFRFLALKEYGYQNKWKKELKSHTYKLVEDALGRLQTDYIDVLFLPHALTMPEMLDDELLREMFEELKNKGIIKASAVSFHNDVTTNLSKSIDAGFYDVTMFAYNIANHAALESNIYRAKQHDMGLIAMKLARKFAMSDYPSWIEDKLNEAIPDKSLSKFTKAYLWGLQNENLSACISQMETIEMIKENLSLIGKKVELTKV